jgi:hypothetical protein
MASERERLTTTEFMEMFGRTFEDARWVGSADSSEYLAVVTYIVERNRADA